MWSYLKKRFVGRKNTYVKIDVLEKLFNGKLNRDCISYIRTYLHSNDIELIKKAYIPGYRMQMQFYKYEYDNVKNTGQFEHKYGDYTYSSEDACLHDIMYAVTCCGSINSFDNKEIIKQIVEKNYIRCIRYICKSKIEDKIYNAQFCTYENKLLNTIIYYNNLDIFKYFVQNYKIDLPNLYSLVFHYQILNYLYDELHVPIPANVYEKSQKNIHNVYSAKVITLTEKFEWLYSHGAKPIYADYEGIINNCPQRFMDFKIIAWLLDHGCPYKP